ncbi:MAG: preprotein translocase subunit SecY [Candidatus Micrarchaeia archaeon]|jgi:preprotein translocase subunit SecY
MLNFLKPILNVLPEVKRPHRPPTLQEKLLWTLAALLIFFGLGQLYPIGVDVTAIKASGLERLEILLGSKVGSLITAGIGPIILASIFLQLAVGARLISLDLSNPENKKTFQGLQKLLAILLGVLEAVIYVLPTAGGQGYVPLVDHALGTILLVVLQLSLGSIILLYLDEVVQKYGIGSGISLFIAAGVSRTVIMGALSPLALPGADSPEGLIPQAIVNAGIDLAGSVWLLMPLVFAAIVFLGAVYFEAMKIELPIAYGRARGLGMRYPLKFLYVSNIPVILASAVMLNVQLFGMFMANAGMPLMFGPYEQNRPVCDINHNLFTVGDVPICGLSYYATALPSPILMTGGYQAYLQTYSTPPEIMHILFYGLLLVSLSVVFGWFWVESTGMGPKNVAEQLNRSGLQIPGFRQDPRVIEKILERYIPVITILGSIAVGILAWFADITGALGTGTGILLTVGILYRFYEDLAKQQVFEMYPMLNKLVK